MCLILVVSIKCIGYVYQMLNTLLLLLSTEKTEKVLVILLHIFNILQYVHLRVRTVYKSKKKILDNIR